MDWTSVTDNERSDCEKEAARRRNYEESLARALAGAPARHGDDLTACAIGTMGRANEQAAVSADDALLASRAPSRPTSADATGARRSGAETTARYEPFAASHRSATHMVGRHPSADDAERDKQARRAVSVISRIALLVLHSVAAAPGAVLLFARPSQLRSFGIVVSDTVGWCSFALVFTLVVHVSWLVATRIGVLSESSRALTDEPIDP